MIRIISSKIRLFCAGLSNYSIYFRLLFALVVLLFFLIVIDVDEVLSFLSAVSCLDILVLLLILFVRNYFAAIRFQLLLGNQVRVAQGELIRQYFVASLFNMFIPTAIGGDGVRIILLAKQKLSKTDAGILILAERLIGFYSLISISFIATFLWETPDIIYLIATSLFGGYTVIMSGVLYLPFTRIKNKWPVRFIDRMSNICLELRSRPGDVVAVFIFSILYQLSAIYISYYVALAIGLVPNVLHFLTIVPIVWLVTMIPISVGGLGLRELSFTFLLSLVGYTHEMSTGVSLGTYFALVMSACIGAVIIVISNIRPILKADQET